MRLTIIILLLSLHAQGQKDNLGTVLLKIDIDHVSIFVNHVYDDAKIIADSFNIPISIIIGQSALETKYGLSRRCEEDNNYFGVKRNHEFMIYKNIEDSFQDYAKVLSQSCYKELKPETLAEWYNALQQCGYFTSTTYITKLNNIIFRYNLDLL